MINKRMENIFFAIAIIVVMYFCFTGLAKQFDPEHVFDIRIRPAYTNTAFEDLLIEKIYYEKNFKEIEEILQ